MPGIERINGINPTVEQEAPVGTVVDRQDITGSL